MPVCQKLTGEVIKIAFSVSVRTNWNKLFLKDMCFLFLFHILIGNFLPYSFLCWRTLSNLPSACRYEPFEKKFLSKSSLLNHFQNWVVFFENFDKNSPPGLSEKQYWRPGEQVEEKFCFLFLKKMHLSSFSDTGRKLLAHFSTSFRRSCQKCVLRVFTNIFKEKTYLLKQKFCDVFQILSGIFLDFHRNFPDCLVKTASKAFDGTFR